MPRAVAPDEGLDFFWNDLKRTIGSVYVTARVPVALFQEIESFQQREFCRRSAAIRTLLERGLAAS